jgi:hypothetical protein
MDYEFFEKLSADEARAYFDRYLEFEAREVEAMLEEARSDGVAADFSVDSIAAVFAWLRSKIRVVAVEPAGDTPAWLRESMEEHHGGFLDFDDESRSLVLRASYYFGQSFVSSYERLEWALGREDRAEFQQPVVTGFRTDADLPPLVVAENLLLRASESGVEEHVETAVATWRNAV